MKRRRKGKRREKRRGRRRRRRSSPSLSQLHSPAGPCCALGALRVPSSVAGGVCVPAWSWDAMYPAALPWGDLPGNQLPCGDTHCRQLGAYVKALGQVWASGEPQGERQSRGPAQAMQPRCWGAQGAVEPLEQERQLGQGPRGCSVETGEGGRQGPGVQLPVWLWDQAAVPGCSWLAGTQLRAQPGPLRPAALPAVALWLPTH